MVTNLLQGFRSDVRHVAGDRDEPRAAGCQSVAEGGMKTGERACAPGVVIETKDPRCELGIGPCFADEHRIKTRGAALANERFEDRFLSTWERQEPFVLPHSARLPSDENSEKWRRRHDSLDWNPSVAQEARFELLDDAIDLVLLNGARDEVGEERRRVRGDVEDDGDD